METSKNLSCSHCFFFFFFLGGGGGGEGGGGGRGEEGKGEVMLLEKKATPQPYAYVNYNSAQLLLFGHAFQRLFFSYIAMLAQAGISQDNNVTIFSAAMKTRKIVSSWDL